MKYSFLIDPDKCTGCRRCEVACSFFKEQECNPAKSRVRVAKEEKDFINVPFLCVHCDKPYCQEVCPVEAIFRDENTSAILVNEDTCIGCRLCAIACPIGAIYLDPEKGTILKCDLCNGDPKCVKYCDVKALQYIPGFLFSTLKITEKAKKFFDLLR